MKKLASEWNRGSELYSLNMMQKFYTHQAAFCYVMSEIKHNSIIIKCSANETSPRRCKAVLIETFNPKLAETFWPDFSKKWTSNFYKILGLSKAVSGDLALIPKEILDYIASMIVPTEVIAHYDHKADRFDL